MTTVIDAPWHVGKRSVVARAPTHVVAALSREGTMLWSRQWPAAPLGRLTPESVVDSLATNERGEVAALVSFSRGHAAVNLGLREVPPDRPGQALVRWDPSGKATVQVWVDAQTQPYDLRHLWLLDNGNMVAQAELRPGSVLSIQESVLYFDSSGVFGGQHPLLADDAMAVGPDGTTAIATTTTNGCTVLVVSTRDNVRFYKSWCTRMLISRLWVDAAGRVYVVGFTDWPLDLGGRVIEPAGVGHFGQGPSTQFVARYAADGKLDWSQSFTIDGGLDDFRVGRDGWVFLTGSLQGSTSVAGIPLASRRRDKPDAFFVEFDPNGQSARARILGPAGETHVVPQPDGDAIVYIWNNSELEPGVDELYRWAPAADADPLSPSACAVARLCVAHAPSTVNSSR